MLCLYSDIQVKKWQINSLICRISYCVIIWNPRGKLLVVKCREKLDGGKDGIVVGSNP